MSLERPLLPVPTPGQFAADLTVGQAVNAVVAFLFAVTGPVAIMLTVGTRGGMSEAQMASWIFGAFYLNGLISFVLCLLYRQPLVFFWTIPGVVLVGPALAHLSFAEVVGAYVLTSALMLALGLSGWVRRCMAAVPMPIVMGMVAGVFLQFGLDWIAAFSEAPGIAAPMTVAFFAVAAWPAVAKRFPPLFAALAVGAVAMAMLGTLPAADRIPLDIARPVFTMPEFSWQAVVELVVPLTITVMVVQNGQGFAVLSAAGHKPPINVIATVCGIGALLVSTAGTVSTCLTGPVSGIIVAEGRKEGHYAAGVLVALLAVLFGLMAPMFTGVMLATPRAFISTLAGIALLRVLLGAFTTAFQGPCAIGALVAFTVTVSNLSIYNIGAPFWGLVLGFAASWLVERKDFPRPDAA